LIHGEKTVSDATEYFHWSCNGKTFTNKFKALYEKDLSGDVVQFNIPTSYNNVSWNQEPTQSWKEILKNRAQEIRDSYKKVRLFYSGGSDSTCVLHAFIDNNIFIDEIVVSIKYPKEVGADPEPVNVAIPYIESIKHKIPNTKFTLAQVTIEDCRQIVADPFFWQHLIRYPSLMCGTASSGYQGLVPQLYSKFVEDDCINIICRDKPRLKWINNKCYTYWLDSSVQAMSAPWNSTACFFYNDSPTVYLKQCHLLKQYIENNFPIDKWNTICNYKTNESQTAWMIGSGRINKDQSPPTLKQFDIKLFTDSEVQQLLSVGISDLSRETLKYRELRRILDFISAGYTDIVKDTLRAQEVSTAYHHWFNDGQIGKGPIGCLTNFYCLTDGSVETVDNLFPNGFS